MEQVFALFIEQFYSGHEVATLFFFLGQTCLGFVWVYQSSEGQRVNVILYLQVHVCKHLCVRLLIVIFQVRWTRSEQLEDCNPTTRGLLFLVALPLIEILHTENEHVDDAHHGTAICMTLIEPETEGAYFGACKYYPFCDMLPTDTLVLASEG